MSGKFDLTIMRRDIRGSRDAFNGSNRPLDMPVRVWIDVAEQLTDEVERLQVREVRLCSELARLALDYVATQDEAHAELDEQQLAAEMLVFVDTWQT